MTRNDYQVYGLDASYFTQKLLGILRFKQLDFRYDKKTILNREEIEAKSGTHLFPVLVTPDQEWLWDTSPIAHELDRRHPARPLLPESPLDLALCLILEDFFDEWLTRQAIHFRWHHEQDRQSSGQTLAREMAGLPSEGDLTAEQQQLVEQNLAFMTRWGRQTCANVGAGQDRTEEMIGDFVRLSELLHQHLDRTAFLLGNAPCLADFALYGGLAAHFLHDPTPKQLIDRFAPALHDYAARLDQAGDCTDRLDPNATIPETLAPILQFVGQGFHRFLATNRQALAQGRKRFRLDLGYGPVDMLSRKYPEKSRVMTVAMLRRLRSDEQQTLSEQLSPLDIWDAYQDA